MRAGASAKLYQDHLVPDLEKSPLPVPSGALRAAPLPSHSRQRIGSQRLTCSSALPVEVSVFARRRRRESRDRPSGLDGLYEPHWLAFQSGAMKIVRDIDGQSLFMEDASLEEPGRTRMSSRRPRRPSGSAPRPSGRAHEIRRSPDMTAVSPRPTGAAIGDPLRAFWR